MDVMQFHDRLDAIDGGLLALLEQFGHVGAAQLNQAA